MTLGLVSLGAATDLLDASFSGFAYPPRRIVMPLIANDVAQSQVAIIQDGPRTHREATLTFHARDTTELELIRGYDEDGTTVVFVDFAGTSHDVLISSFSSALRFGDLWGVTVTMLEVVVEATAATLTLSMAYTDPPTGGDFDVAVAWTGGSDVITLPFDADETDVLTALGAAMGVTLTDYVSGALPDGSPLVYVNPGDTLLPLLSAALDTDNTTGGTDVVITVDFTAGHEA